jgi:membrane-bound lytic murein transglycosylase MltF
MVERRVIRALVAYSKTTYFLDGARPRGLTYAALMHFEGAVNEALGSGPLRVHVMVIPVPRDELLPALVEGRGDLAASNLTITPERRRSVAFSDPLMRGVSEVVVTGPGGPELESLADLAAQEVHVRASSSYYESLQHLNARLREQGREPTRIQAADELLEDEDILEMVNAGLLPATIVDDHKARFWAQVLDDITVHAGLSVREEGDIGWAFRKDSPRLAQVVNDFVRQNRQGTLYGNVTLKRYLAEADYVVNHTEGEGNRRFEATWRPTRTSASPTCRDLRTTCTPVRSTSASSRTVTLSTSPWIG